MRSRPHQCLFEPGLSMLPLLRRSTAYDLNAPEGSEEDERLEVLSELVRAYEDEHEPEPEGTPRHAVQFMLEQKRMDLLDLAPVMGGHLAVRHFFGGKPLSESQIAALHALLGIPVDLLASQTGEWDTTTSAALRTVEPVAVSARFEPNDGRIYLELESGALFAFPARETTRMKTASNEELAEVELVMDGMGLHWETLDEDLLVPGLIARYVNFNEWAPKRLHEIKAGEEWKAATEALEMKSAHE